MKRLFLFWIIGLGTILSAYSLSRDYYLKQAEGYQREAKFYFNQAEGYECDAQYYNNQAQKYLKDAEYYAGKNDLDKVATYQRWAKDALDKAQMRTRWADEARDKGKTRLESVVYYEVVGDIPQTGACNVVVFNGEEDPKTYQLKMGKVKQRKDVTKIRIQ